MPRSPSLLVLVAASALAGCGSLDANTDSAPTLATVKGSVINPNALPVNGAVRVAVVWRMAQGGQFNVAEDLPVQAIFPSAFTIQLDGPPPADVMNSAAVLAGPPAEGPEAGATSSFMAAGAAGDDGGLMPQSLHPLATPGSSNGGSFAVGTVVAYVDRNGNGKLDLVGPDAGAYIDQVLATNVETSIVYLEGPIPGALFQNAHGTPREGYNLFDQPPCPIPTAGMQAMVNPIGFSPNPACPQTSTADASVSLPVGTIVPVRKCPEGSWLPISTPFVLTVATAPQISQVACENGGADNQASFGTGSGTMPPPPSVQPAQYPDPCDPNLSCATDGSQYFYATCTIVNQGLCLPSYTSCTSVGYMRPTPTPAGWPCLP
jgi:hypothetical protein